MLSIDPTFAEQLATMIVDRLPEPQPIVPHELLVDGDRLAELLSVSRPTVDRLVRQGRIPSVSIGRRRLYDPQDVIASLKGGNRC